MRFDDRITVNLQPAEGDAEELYLVTDLGAPARGEAVYEMLLRGNLFWRATQAPP